MKISEVITRSKLNTEEERLKAVSHNGHIIRFIENPSEAVQLAAMRQNGYALQHIEDQSPAVQMTAISNDPNAIEFIRSMDPSLLKDPHAKKTIIMALLKFIKEGSDADVSTPDESVKNVGMRFVDMLRRIGCKWPEIDVIEKSLRSLPDPEMDGDMIDEAELHTGFDPQKILSHIAGLEDNGVRLTIPVNKPFTDAIYIDKISMYVGTTEEDGEGDLGVHYTIEEPDIGEPMPDEAKIAQMFYRDGAYDDELSHILMLSGFSRNASRVAGSEWGMQEEGKASYDAPDVAEEVREAIANTPSSELAKTLVGNILRDVGANINDPEPTKDAIIKWMLSAIKKSSRVPVDVKMAAEVLLQSGVKWPELETILRSAGTQ